MTTVAKSALPVTLGLMTWGKAGQQYSRVSDVKDCAKMLDVFQKHGHNEVDNSYQYNGGTSEELLGELDPKKRGIVIGTKLYPNKAFGGPITHSPEDLRKYIRLQLEACKVTSFDIWYLHGPDRSTPYETTLATVNELYKEGLFKRFGISNYMSWEVAEIVGICDKHGWVKPTVYQGMYNAIQRSVEAELFPCIRKFGMSFYEFNPLGGGFFTGQYTRDGEVEAGSRFDPKLHQGQAYRTRYWSDEYFNALDALKPIVEKYNLTLAEAALRWVSKHSLMKRELGDNIIIGASSVEHLEANLIDLEKGPLPEEVVLALDVAWAKCKPVAAKYHH